jgi:hypothetical protein
MRHRKNREINIFSMSALDLFACALGAFLLLMIMLFPYYKNETDTKQRLQTSQEEARNCKSQIEQAERQRQQAEKQREEAQRELRDAQQQTQQCARQLGSGVLLATVSWEHDDRRVRDTNDVDLYVVDPEGKQYSFQNPVHAGTSARLSLDSTATPGFEVFEDPVIRPGAYHFAVALYAKTAIGDNPISIRVRLYTRMGGQDAPIIRIVPSRQAGKLFQVGIITIGPSGEPSVQFN